MVVVESLASTLEWERLATNLRVEGALMDALEILSDFPVVVFKGAVLTRLIYDDLRARASCDNDLWIRAADTQEVLRRLLDAGFRPLQGLDAEAAVRRTGQVDLWPAGDFKQPSLDLHRSPFSIRYFSVSEETLANNLMSIVIHDREVQTFNHRLALTHLVAHYIQHHFEEERLVDLGAAWDRWQTHLDGLWGLAAKTCTNPGLLFSLHRAHQKGYCRIPPPAPLCVRSRLVTATLDEPFFQHSIGRKFLSLFLTNPHRLRQGIWSSVFLEKDDLESRYGVGTPWHQYWCHLRHLLDR